MLDGACWQSLVVNGSFWLLGSLPRSYLFCIRANLRHESASEANKPSNLFRWSEQPRRVMAREQSVVGRREMG